MNNLTATETLLCNKIADVLDTKLPWIRKDLLDFAEEIVKVFPHQLTEEEVEKIIFDNSPKREN